MFIGNVLLIVMNGEVGILCGSPVGFWLWVLAATALVVPAVLRWRRSRRSAPLAAMGV
jgi:hypothetical protein